MQPLNALNMRLTPGECLVNGGYPVEALPFLEKEVAVNPRAVAPWNNLGICHKWLGHYDAAIECFRKAIEIYSGLTQAIHNLGMCYEETGQFEKALPCYVKSASWSGHPNDLYALAGCMLRERMFDKGGKFWETARLGINSAMLLPNIEVWRGQHLAGKSILVTREGGYGDIFWLLRYLKPLKDMGAHVTFAMMPSQIPLLDGHPFTDRVVDCNVAVTTQDYDYQVPLWSVMFELRKFGIGIPLQMEGPYIHAEPLEISRGFNVGLAPYAGEVFSVHRKMRSFEPALVERFSKLPFRFTWLCSGKAPGWCSASVEEGTSWLETARLVAGLDLVICADSSVMHLSGCMGKKTIAIVPTGSDWKWFHEKESTPWYPTVRVIVNQDPVSFSPGIDKAIEFLQEESEREASCLHSLSSR